MCNVYTIYKENKAMELVCRTQGKCLFNIMSRLYNREEGMCVLIVKCTYQCFSVGALYMIPQLLFCKLFKILSPVNIDKIINTCISDF